MVRRLSIAFLVLASALASAPALSQQASEITENQRRLEEIRRERNELREEMVRIRSRVRDISAELDNLRRQVGTSVQLLNELESQVRGTEQEIHDNTRELLVAQDRIAERKAVLNRRLREIYKRGPLQTVQVLLAAESFGDLLSRYKYLHRIANHDRDLIREVQRLEQLLAFRERRLHRGLDDLRMLRQQQESEAQQLALLERQQQQALSSVRTTERTTAQRIDQLARDEQQLASLIAELERRRKEAERVAEERRRRDEAAAAARAAAGAGSARPASPRTPAPAPAMRDLGTLPWPVDGTLVYSFGRQVLPNGTAIRHNGVGIAAASGTPVRAVEGGTIVLASSFEGYGPTVVVDHGGGYYSLYLYLRDISVREGAQITRGQLVGTVGGDGLSGRTHMEFQVRSPGGQAVDPLTWLQRRSGA
jgi:murein hydrolase activator